MEGSTIQWQKLRKSKTAMAGIIVILLATVVAIFCYWISPDCTPDANRMQVEIAGKKPGFTQTFFLLPKTPRPPERNWWQRTLHGQPDSCQFIPITAHEVNDTAYILDRYIDNGISEKMNVPLSQLNGAVQSNEGKLPLTVQGPLQPKDISIDGSLSSQFLTGLLIAYAASGADGVSITVTNLKSKPYVDLTLSVMDAFGLPVPENINYEKFVFKGGETDKNRERTYTVEGDWSGGAFLLVAGAIAGNITVRGLDVHSTQADKAILHALSQCGAGISIETNQINLRPASLKAFQFDATDCPDLFPPLVALAAYCKGTTVIQGVSRLEHKESNRAITLQDEFDKMGVEIDLQDDLMLIKGTGKVKGADLFSHHDHRIAMAGAVAALKAEGYTSIEDAEAIKKSYPDFYDHISLLGAKLKTTN